MRHPIISDTTRSVSIESDIVEIDGVDCEIWAVVVRCPVNGIYVENYCASREEATADLNARFAA